MENILEKLAVETNYQQYLQRMTASISKSSKGFIPFLVSMNANHPGYRILDVGCGSGVLMKAILEVCPDAEMVGVDLNRKSVEECLAVGLNAIHGSLAEITDAGEKFDCVIFSSVLHEISSYDESQPFSLHPICDALSDANRCLNSGGKVIIRDGVGCPIDDSDDIRFSFHDEKDVRWLKRFQAEFKAFDVSFKQLSQSEIIMPAYQAKEFFYTYTWGEGSWPREVQEKFGIATIADWQKMIRAAGFRISMQMANTEEYLKYLSQKIVITPEIEVMFEQATCLFVAEKV